MDVWINNFMVRKGLSFCHVFVFGERDFFLFVSHNFSNFLSAFLGFFEIRKANIFCLTQYLMYQLLCGSIVL